MEGGQSATLLSCCTLGMTVYPRARAARKGGLHEAGSGYNNFWASPMRGLSIRRQRLCPAAWGEMSVKATLVLGLITLLLVVVFPPPMTTAQTLSMAETELRTALVQVKLLQRGLGVLAPQVYLQRVINCLEGPNGKNFNAAVGSACEGEGNGILPDLRAAAGANEARADLALRHATVAWRVALAAVNLIDSNEVEQQANVVASYLRRALDALH